MAGNTKCYKVTVGADGGLQFDVVEFSPRFADSVSDALMRLRSAGELLPPHLRFSDRPELERRWRAVQP
jgi:hypothetical protein